MHSFHRPFSLCVLVLLVYQYFCLCLFISPASLTQIQQIDSSFPNLARATLLASFQHSSSVMYIGTTINGIVALLFIADIILHKLTANSNLNHEKNTSKNIKKNSRIKHLKSIQTRVQWMLSCIMSIYTYVFFIPFIYHAFENFSTNKVAAFLITSTSIISIVHALYSASFSFSKQDALLSRSPVLGVVMQRVFEFIGCMILSINNEQSSSSDNGVLLLLPIILAMLQIILFGWGYYMNSSQMLLIEFTLSEIQLLIPAAILLAIELDTMESILVLCVVVLPSLYAIARVKTECSLDAFFELKKAMRTSTYSRKVDYLIRQLIESSKLEYEDYKTRAASLFLEEITTEHLATCEYYPRCFCNLEEIKEFDDFKKLIVSSTYRQRFLNSFVSNLYLQICNRSSTNLSHNNNRKQRSNNIDAQLSFISYLIEVKQSKVQSFCEIIKLASASNVSLSSSVTSPSIHPSSEKQSSLNSPSPFESKLSWRKKPLLVELFELARSKFDESSNSSDSSTQINNTSATSPDYLSGIRFDEDLNRLEKLYFEALQEKEYLIQMLSSDYIDLRELKDKAIAYSHSRHDIEGALHALSSVHFQSQKLQFYLDRYVALLSFASRKKSFFNPLNNNNNAASATDIYKNNGDSTHQLKLQQRRQQNTRNNNNNINQFKLNSSNALFQQHSSSSIFEKDNCVVFITLIGQIGTIRRAQNKFENMFGIPLHKVLGQNISIILPDCILAQHDLTLRNYVEQQDIAESNNSYSQMQSTTPAAAPNTSSGNMIYSEQLIKSSVVHRNEILLAKNSRGWAVPVALSFKADYIGMDDFGLTAHMTKLKTDSVYVMTAVKSFQIELISEKLYDRVLRDHCTSESDIRRIYFNRIIPILPYFERLELFSSTSSNANSKNNELLTNKQQQQLKQEQQEHPLHSIRTIAFLPRMLETVKSKASFSISTIAGSAFRRKKAFIFDPMMGYSSTTKGNYERELRTYSLQKMDMYAVKISVTVKRAKYFAYNIIELSSFKRITDPAEQHDQLIFFQAQLQSLLGVNFKLANTDHDILPHLETGNTAFSSEWQNHSTHPTTPKKSFKEPIPEEGPSNMNGPSPKSEQLIAEAQEDLYINLKLRPRKQISTYTDDALLKSKLQSSILLDPIQDGAYQNPNNTENEIMATSNNALNYNSNVIIPSSNIKKQISLNSDRNVQIAGISPPSQFGRRFSTGKEQLTNLAARETNNLPNKNQQYQQQNQLNQSISLTENQLLPVQNTTQVNNPENERINRQIPKQPSNAIPSNNRANAQTPSKPKKRTFFALLKEKLRILKTSGQNQSPTSDPFLPSFNGGPQQEQQTNQQHASVQQEATKHRNQQTYNSQISYHFDKQISLSQAADLKSFIKFTSQISGSGGGNNAGGTSSNNYHKNMQQPDEINSNNHKSVKPLISASNCYNLNDIQLYETSGGIDLLQAKHIHGHNHNQNEQKIKGNNQNNAIVAAAAGSNEKDSPDSSKANSEEDEQNLRIFEQAASSVHTNKSYNFDQKRILKESIRSNKRNFFMTALTGFGLIALTTIIALTVYQYTNITTQLGLTNDYFAFIPWPMTLRSAFVTMMNEESILSLIHNNVFPDIAANNFEEEQHAKITNSVNEFLNLFYLYQNSDADQIGFLSYFYNHMSLTISVDDLVSINPETYNESEKSTSQVSIAYFIQQMTAYLFLKKQQYEQRLIYQKVQTDNFVPFNENLVNIQGLIQKEVVALIDSIIVQVSLLLALVITFAVLMILAIFPIYYLVQSKNERLLKLFATISPDLLKSMLIPVQLALTERAIAEINSRITINNNNNHASEDTTTHIKSFNNNSSKFIRKKKIISSTGSLSKFKVSLAISSLFAFCMIIIQPITNFILIKSFQSEAEANITFLSNLYDIKANCVSSSALNLQHILSQMVPSEPMYNSEYYLERIPIVLAQNQQKLETMYATIKQNEASSRYQQSLYDGFLYAILEHDICEKFSEYPQYVSAENYLSKDSCETINGGSLRNGFQMNVKSFFSIFSEWNVFYNYDAEGVTHEMLEWEANFKFQDFIQYENAIFKIINVIKDFMLKMMNDQLEEMKVIQSLLLAFQLVALLLIFAFGWMRFFYFVQKDMHIVKNLLTILPLDLLIENPYIVSFLSR